MNTTRNTCSFVQVKTLQGQKVVDSEHVNMVAAWSYWLANSLHVLIIRHTQLYPPHHLTPSPTTTMPRTSSVHAPAVHHCMHY